MVDNGGPVRPVRADGPAPANDVVRRRFEAQRRRDTGPELAIRKELHRRGLRYRVDASPDGGRLRADIVFPRARVAVFVDGCFWHCCPTHGSTPSNNNAWWREKFNKTVARDRRIDAQLTAAGWKVLRIWEHEPVVEAATRIVDTVRQSLA